MASWVPPGQIHLTIKFLGEIDDSLCSALQPDMSRIASGTPPFTLAADQPGAFPSMRNPRVLWVGIQDSTRCLEELAGKVESACVKHGFPPEDRNFHPHLTLCRIKKEHSYFPAGLHSLPAGDFHAGSFDATRLILFQSILKPSGAVYHPLATFPFCRSEE